MQVPSGDVVHDIAIVAVILDFTHKTFGQGVEQRRAAVFPRLPPQLLAHIP